MKKNFIRDNSSASSNACSTSSTASSMSSDWTASSNACSTIESLIHFTSLSEQEEEVEEEFDLLNRLNNLNITATDLWTLAKTNRNKPKLASMGFYYTQACTLKKTGEIKWKCELTKTCPAIGFSPGMSGPFDLRTEHKHQANPERLNILINNQKIKEKAMCSNDQPRSIMINANKHLSREESCIMPSQGAMRRFILLLTTRFFPWFMDFCQIRKRILIKNSLK